LPPASCPSGRPRLAPSEWSSYGFEAGGVAFSGAKVAELEDDVPGRGVPVAGLAGAACGRKLLAPERGALDDGGGLLAPGLVPGRAGADEPDPVEVGLADGGEFSPGVLRVDDPPPLATARAAAASAGLEAPRIGATALLEGGGVAIVGPDAEPEAAGTGRTLLDCEDGRELDDGLDGTAVGRPLPEADDDSEDVDGVAEAGRPLDAPEPDGVAAGRAGAAAGRDEAGGVGVAGGGVLVTAGEAAVTGPSGRAAAGRTRVVSSPPPSPLPLDVTFGDASVLIGTVPPPGICRDVFSDRWLLSELTFHLHAQAADEEPSSDAACVRLGIGQQG
jgi:hypothetical protein